MALSDKQQRFVAEYLVDLNATQAAIRAGYSPNRANATAHNLLTNTDIAQAIAEGQARALDKVGLTAELTLEAIRRPLAADVRKLFDEKGNIRPLHELNDEEAALIGGFETIIKNAKAGDGHTDEVLKLKLVDRCRYVEMAAKHFALLTEKHQVNIDAGAELLALLVEGRKRVAKDKGE